MSRQSLAKPISIDQQSSRGWRLSLNGFLVEHVESLVLDHTSFGTLTYGALPMGYDGWVFHEHGGGGVVTLPFVMMGGEAVVGLVQQHRPLQGGLIWNAPRGFLDPGEGRREGALRELAEEMGLRATDLQGIDLPGAPGNPNSAFFETWVEGEGISFHALELPVSALHTTPDGLVLRDDLVDRSAAAQRSRLAEAIVKARFVPWYEAAQCGDLLTNAAVARLLVHLRGRV